MGMKKQIYPHTKRGQSAEGAQIDKISPRYGVGVYLDYAATTPIDSRVLAAMTPFLKGDFGNASSIHGLGQKAREAIDKAREQVAEFLNCDASEIIFTGSATEADNMAVLGPVRSLCKSHLLPPTEPIGGFA